MVGSKAACRQTWCWRKKLRVLTSWFTGNKKWSVSLDMAWTYETSKPTSTATHLAQQSHTFQSCHSLRAYWGKLPSDYQISSVSSTHVTEFLEFQLKEILCPFCLLQEPAYIYVHRSKHTQKSILRKKGTITAFCLCPEKQSETEFWNNIVQSK